MDEYQHLRDSADVDAAAYRLNVAGEPWNDPRHPDNIDPDLLWLPPTIRHMQGIPARDTRDEDRAQKARREAREMRQHAYYDVLPGQTLAIYEKIADGDNPFAPNPYIR